MKLIVGLGNPGKKFIKTRHNIGFRIIDALMKKISDKDIIFLKPETFMNNSGNAVQTALAYYKISVENLCVIHDDIDLPFGTVKISKDSSSAGHKGVQSIIDELKTKKFTRIRIGIKPIHIVDTTEFVLKNFTKKEEKKIKEITKKAVDAIESAFLASCS